MARGGIRKGITLVAAVGMTLWAATAFSQQVTPQQKTRQTKPSPRLVFSLSSGINADTNRDLRIGSPNRATTLDTRVGLAYSAKTRLQSFDASLSALWRLGKTGNAAGGSGLQEPEAKLSYKFDNGATRASASGYYRKSQVNLLEPLTLSDGTLSPTDLVATTGSVISWGGRLGFESGVNDPIDVLASASTDRRHYLNNTDPNVYDSRSNRLSTTLRFNIDALSRIDVTATAFRQSYDNTIHTRRRQTQFGLGYSRQLTPTLRLQGQIGYSQDRTDEFLFGVVPYQQKASGLFGSVGLSQALANGSASVTLSSQRDSFGSRNSLKFGRALNLPSAKLDAQAGLSVRPGYGAQAIGKISYGLKGPTDSVTAALSRQVTLDANNNDVAYTSLGLGYAHKVNEVSSLGVNVSLSHAGDGGLGTVHNIDRQSLRATYSYALTENWSLDAGYLFRHLREKGTGDATSNSVFFKIGRKFTLWP